MKKTEFNDILILMRLQNAYINQISKFISSLYTDLNIAGNITFQEFTEHFNIFARNHACSEGFSKAMDNLQTYNCYLLEKLLSNEVLSAAEQLELAISHLESLVRLHHNNSQILLLSHTISFLEETQLGIIESLEKMLENYGQIQFQN